MPRPDAAHDRLAAAFLTVLASVLLLSNLGDHYLWQDEAQTALVARTILDGGLPRGTDGRNFFSQELGKEYADGYVWKWHTWLSFYLVAASFAALGPTTFAARLPFALCGIATVLLAHRTARLLWRDRTSALAAAGLLSLCVPFLIFNRQCRYYGAASLFCLLGLYAYARLRPGDRRAPWLLFAAGFLTFHTHYVYCAALLASAGLHAALFARERLRTVALVTAAVAAVNLPWIVWFSSVRPSGAGYWASVLDLGKIARFTGEYGALLADHYFAPGFLLIPLGLAVWRAFAREPVFAVRRETWSHVALLAIFCSVTVLTLAALSPLRFYRYLTPLAAPIFLVIGLLVGALAARSRWLALAAVALWLGTGRIGDYLYEITHDFDGPIEGIVRFLDEHARPGDVVAISYGDMPLKFYTDLRVVGGLTGEDLSEAARADWIILRRSANSAPHVRVRDALARIAESDAYVAREIEAPDTAFENREHPALHRFRTADARYPRIVVYEKRRP